MRCPLAGLLARTWERTSDIVTIVTPLLVAGQRAAGAAQPLRRRPGDQPPAVAGHPWWLGLPVLLGVPILFGVLRKELSLLMVYQALGTLEIDRSSTGCRSPLSWCS
jgi:ferrous iron transport protein B